MYITNRDANARNDQNWTPITVKCLLLDSCDYLAIRTVAHGMKNPFG